MRYSIFTSFLSLCTCLLFSQVKAQDLQADNMLLFQRDNGGWYKQFHGKAFKYDVVFTDTQKAEIADEVNKGEATIDNEATCKEIRYLVKIYKTVNNPKYLAAAENGIRYLLKAQYKNGGFPQYYPDKSLYRAQITYNDNAMLNALNILQDVALKQNGLEIVDAKLIAPSADAVSWGIDCILKTQIKVKGKLTAWCQQYDQNTLQPAKARAFELPSITASESVGLTRFLMAQPNPSPAIKTAITASVEWLKAVKLEGIKVVQFDAPGTPKGTDKRVEADPSSTLWARYYEIDTNKPFFSDRDGIVRYSIQELGYERRNGYAWYGTWPQKLIEKDYPNWARKNL